MCYGALHEAVIVVVARERAGLSACLDRLIAAVEHAQTEGVHSFIYVVDNVSPDAVANLVDGYHESVYWVRNTRELGYAEARNWNLRQARRQGHRFVIFVDPHALIPPNLVTDLVGCMRWYEDVGLAEPREAQAVSDAAIPAVASGLPPGASEPEDPDSAAHPDDCDIPGAPDVIDRLVLRGAVFIVRVGVSSIGQFDEAHRSPLALDDLCRRTRHDGWRVVQAPQLTIQYEGPASEGGSQMRRMCDTLYLTCCDPALAWTYLAKLMGMMLGMLALAGAGRKPWSGAGKVAVFIGAVAMLVGRGPRVIDRRRSARKLLASPTWRSRPAESSTELAARQ